MTLDIGAILFQDGLANGSVYILMAVALVLVFTVSRIVFVPQGDLVAFSALTLAALEGGMLPGTVWMVLGLSATATAFNILNALTSRDFVPLPWALTEDLLIPVAVVLVAVFGTPEGSPLLWKMAVTVALTTCLAPLLFRVAFQPIAGASPLVLLIAAIALHLGLNSLGLHVFGAEGVRTTGFSGPPFALGNIVFTQQSIGVIAISFLLVLALYLFFAKTLRGKALLAAAYNRKGAEILGISPIRAGRTAFILAGFIGAVAGLLIGPMTTLSYDSGFILGLKGFVGAIVGGLSIYPVAAAGAILVGLIESFASFWASAYRDVIVFTLIIPVLFWRSLRTPHIDEEDE
jgi:branched-chain amino acid transport system permease protein